MSPGDVPAYDEEVIKQGLTSLGTEELVAFAASCAERLFALYEYFVARTSIGNVRALRSALDLAWCGGKPGARPGPEVDAGRQVAESLVPYDDDVDWTELSPLAQNAAAAVAYALRAWISGDAQDGVWAARQVYEAADFLVQAGSPLQEYAAMAESDSTAVLLLGAIGSSLEDCRSGDLDGLRANAVMDGERLLGMLQNG